MAPVKSKPTLKSTRKPPLSSSNPKQRFDFLPTLADVARHAGVAVSTASAVLGNKDYCTVTNETRARINAACQSLGYRPNPVARAIRNQRTASIGLILPSLGLGSVLGEQLRTLESRIRGAGMSMVVATHQYDPDSETFALRDQVMRAVDGIVLYPTGDLSPTLKKLMDARFPLVTIDSPLPIHTFNVEVDRFHGGLLQIQHLISRGRTRPLMLIPDRESRSSIIKQSGRARAMHQAGLGFDPSQILRMSAPDNDWAVAASAAILHALDSGFPFDSVCTNSDLVALSVMTALKSRGKRTPEDVAVIGFDDHDFSQHLSPSLTTIRQPRNMGDQAFELLMRQITAMSEGTRLDPQQLTLPTELVIRQST